MPVGWIGFSTASAPEVGERRRDPLALRDWVKGIVEAADAEFVELYFEVGRERACALVYNLDDPVKVKAVIQILKADKYKKLLKPDQAKEALDWEGRFRGGTPSV